MMRRNQLYGRCRRIAETIERDIAYLPGGTIWWYSLPQKGRGNRGAVVKKWTDLLYSCLFCSGFKRILLKAAIAEDFTVHEHSKELFEWMKRNLYNNSEEKVYKEWVKVKNS